ncbi:DHH family phosphoesterase [Mesomycoplasma bovoculi]|uniref:DHHA1 domain-containing protein-1 n=1 Tax=Mesomycoplasma bovoculi M165/69 TaxID=743966 RepID=W5USB1_9BACT|nr:bifunctional oligoribonuclease/PAP phosphatase NrnA [Mesomycoplasma bovoculi]AHH45022.1 DHHA1 domain-containing protein-1 [Mesomycoplasma bovoculi M165/69]
MKTGSYKKIAEIIAAHKNIFIYHHIRPDGDCLGSQNGLGTAIKKNFPDKNVFFIGEPGEVLKFMNFYKTDETKIDSKYFKNSLAITVDTAELDRVCKNEWILEKKFTTIIKIDHHPTKNEDYTDYEWIDTSFVAASEMIGYFLMKNKWKIDAEIAKFVYLGIVTDSGRFLFSSTSPRTFDVSSHLLKTKFDFNSLNWNLSKQSEKEVAFTSYVLQNYKKQGKVIWFNVTKKIQEKFELTEEQWASVNILANIGDARIWIFFIEADDKIRVRLRSNGPKVNTIAQQYGGGGHAMASGINIFKKKEMDEIIQKSIDLIQEFEKNVSR